MTLFLRYSTVFITLVTLVSCNQSGYTITTTKETTNKKSPESYVEGILVMDNKTPDTIWHFKCAIADDQYYFKKAPAFNLGIFLEKQQGTLGSLSTTYQQVDEKEKSDSITYTKTGTLSTFANYKPVDGKATFNRNVSISSDDTREDPITSGLLANSNDMKLFLKIFEKQIKQSLRNGNRVKYISSASCYSNATTIEMIVEYN